MERESIEMSWDQFEITKGIVEKIEESITDFDEIIIKKDGVIVTAKQQYLCIIIESEEERTLNKMIHKMNKDK